MSSETKIQKVKKPRLRVHNGIDMRLGGYTLQQRNHRAVRFPISEKTIIGFILIISYTKYDCNTFVIHIHMHFQCII